MAFIEGSNDGTLNGNTEVELVAAPGSSTRRIVRSLNINNTDTGVVTVTVQYKNSSTHRTIITVNLDVGDVLVFGEEDLFVLDTTNKSIVAFMSAPPTTVNPDFVASYGDST